jgi:two-component system, LytTR family, sensor kinase
MKETLIDRFWWFLAPQRWWFRHIVFWMYRFNNYLFYFIGLDRSLNMEYPASTLIAEILMYVVFIYLHIAVLTPKLLLQGKSGYYIVLTILTIIGFAHIEQVLYPMEGNSFFEVYHYHFANGIETWLQAVGLRVIVEYLYTQTKMQALQTENLNTELAYLKNQLSPHFLFNTLNNIAVISEKYPEKVTPIIIELSNVLRYQLYESEKTSVLLSKEIENLRNYLKLEAIRLNDADCEIRVEGSTNNVQVAPLLFLPFIENAVKYGADPSGKTTVDVLFKIENETLTFYAKNSKPTMKPKQLSGGIGLKNIQRRLKLLYENKHSLDIKEEANSYTVLLKLML